MQQLQQNWNAYSVPLTIPSVVDMRDKVHIDMQMGIARHDWLDENAGYNDSIYGYGIVGEEPTFPGPTILVSRNKPIRVTWHNQLGKNHVLDGYVENSLMDFTESHCYPNCGVPAVVHVHGLESAPQYDGTPKYSIYQNQSSTMTYVNAQYPATKLYHDHAMGLSRLSIWAGLVGFYIISDDEIDRRLNVSRTHDYPLLIADRLLSKTGKLLYSQYQCEPSAHTKWVPESYGNVNTVNGKVMPFLNVPPMQIRFRFANAANSRVYNLSIPFHKDCVAIARDAGYVENVKPLDPDVVLYPFERLEIICDFTHAPKDARYEIRDRQTAVKQLSPYDARVLEIRIEQSHEAPSDHKDEQAVPDKLLQYKDLKALWKSTNGKERLIRLGEYEHHLNCPSKALLLYRDQELSTRQVTQSIHCTYGKVEKWNFKNPTDEAHPFHWHLVTAQCGPTDDAIETNALKDIASIPSDPTNQVSQVCYVACTPGQFLLKDSSRSAKGYLFDPTTEPYLVHCHTLEHEANQMMSFFQLTKDDDLIPNETGKREAKKLTKTMVFAAMGMSILGGLATVASTFVISCERLKILAEPRSLSAAFALSAGVMIFIAFADLWTEAVTCFRAAYTIGGNGDAEAYEHGGATTDIGTCDKNCSGKAWLATSIAFGFGVFIIALVELFVHQCFAKKRASRSSDSVHALSIKMTAPQSKAAENGAYVGTSESLTPIPRDTTRHKTDSSSIEECPISYQDKEEYERTGIMTGIAIAIHNFPEGLALFVSSLQGLRTGMILSLGIILHNLPEGVAIAAPIYYATKSTGQAFKWTFISGIAQPLGALLGYLVVRNGITAAVQAGLYALVAGMLMAITAMELLPGAFRFDPEGTYFARSLFLGVAIIASSLVLLHYAGSA